MVALRVAPTLVFQSSAPILSITLIPEVLVAIVSASGSSVALAIPIDALISWSLLTRLLVFVVLDFNFLTLLEYFEDVGEAVHLWTSQDFKLLFP